MIIINEKLYVYLTGELHKGYFKGIAEKDGKYWYIIFDNSIRYIASVDCINALSKGFSDTVKGFIKDCNNRKGKVTHPESFYVYHINQTKGNLLRAVNKVKHKPLPNVIHL